MAEKKSYTVHRAMHGEGRDYARGDTRELTDADAATLVALGALALEGEEPKVPPVPGVEHTFGKHTGGEPIKHPARRPAAKA